MELLFGWPTKFLLCSLSKITTHLVMIAQLEVGNFVIMSGSDPLTGFSLTREKDGKLNLFLRNFGFLKKNFETQISNLKIQYPGYLDVLESGCTPKGALFTTVFPNVRDYAGNK